MIATSYMQSPIGILEITGSELGISSLKRIEIDHLPKGTENKVLNNCKSQLREYFERKRTSFEVKLDFSGHTDFHKEVWKELLKIPYGHTISYSGIAHGIENPDAVRAVGLANKYNPIAIIVPCHRVIGKNGDLTGYFYGLDTKRMLLELENPMSFSRQGSLF